MSVCLFVLYSANLVVLVYTANNQLQVKHVNRKMLKMAVQESQVEDWSYASVPLQDNKVTAGKTLHPVHGGNYYDSLFRKELGCLPLQNVPSEQQSEPYH